MDITKITRPARKLLPLDRLEDFPFLLLAGGVGAFAGELLAGGVESAAPWLLPGCWGGWLLMLRWTKSGFDLDRDRL